MVAMVNSGTRHRKQIHPIDNETEVSQRLVDASHCGDTETAFWCLESRFIDVNFVGTVSLKSKTTEIVLNDECSHGVQTAYEEFKTEVTALFLAAHNGNLTLLRKLLNMGANVNTRLFRGYATTASVKEGHLKVLEVLINGGASQLACEEALMEASYLGRARFGEILMQSHMIRPHVVVHALVSASCRGFIEVVDVLIKHGVDINAIDRTLLQSSKPFLHANVDCNALFAAVVSRQIHVVKLLLQVGVNLDMKVKLGAWSWEADTGEEFRVGVGLAEPYPITWCAVEYFESTGSILEMLLNHISPNIFHNGRTLLHHAILCNNEKALKIILNSGVADTELASSGETNLYPIHIAARLGSCNILQYLIKSGCDLDSKTNSGDTATMICIRYKHEKCLMVLVSSGADLGIVNSSGDSATSIANSVQWSDVFQRVILDVIRSGKVVRSSNCSRFSAMMLVTRMNNVEGIKKLIENDGSNIDEQNENGFSAAMVAAASGYVEAFKLLLHAGADVLSLRNKYGLTALNLIDLSQNNGEVFQRVLIEYALVKKGCKDNNTIGSNDNEINPLHRAICYGDIDIVHKILKEGYYDVNSLDSNGYTPLMLAARACRSEMCELLISFGAKCDVKNERNETALSLARENGKGSNVESVILDEVSRRVVLCGAIVKKHTKCGKGKPHRKNLVMVGGVGILRWGKSSKRNVVCKEANVGPSEKFRWNRRRKFDVDEVGIFHVVTTKNKEVHFVCSEGGVEMAELWVRGIKLVTREVNFFEDLKKV